MTKEYNDYKRLIQKKAREFSLKYNYDFDELVSEGNLIFCKCLKTHNHQITKFITYLYKALHFGFINKCTRKRTNEYDIDNFKDAFHFYDSHNDKVEFSENTKLVIHSIENEKDKILELNQKNYKNGAYGNKITKRKLFKYMRTKGLRQKEILNSFAEITNLIHL